MPYRRQELYAAADVRVSTPSASPAVCDDVSVFCDVQLKRALSVPNIDFVDRRRSLEALLVDVDDLTIGQLATYRLLNGSRRLLFTRSVETQPLRIEIQIYETHTGIVRQHRETGTPSVPTRFQKRKSVQ